MESLSSITLIANERYKALSGLLFNIALAIAGAVTAIWYDAGKPTVVEWIWIVVGYWTAIFAVWIGYLTLSLLSVEQ